MIMTSRRIGSGEKSALEEDERDGQTPLGAEKSDTSPAVPPAVIIQLLSFTFAMIAGPIATYFVSKDYIYGGNATFAGATAALVANVILIAYVVVAMREDYDEPVRTSGERKKSR